MTTSRFDLRQPIVGTATRAQEGRVMVSPTMTTSTIARGCEPISIAHGRLRRHDSRRPVLSNAVHTRSAGAEVLDVDFTDRIIRVVAAPYNQYAVVPYRGGMWRELFEASAFDGVEAAPEKVRVNREHCSPGVAQDVTVLAWPFDSPAHVRRTLESRHTECFLGRGSSLPFDTGLLCEGVESWHDRKNRTRDRLLRDGELLLSEYCVAARLVLLVFFT
jgi:hypothetical protein